MNLTDIIKVLQHAERHGPSADTPYGFRYIKITDILALEMIQTLQTAVKWTTSLEDQMKP